MYGAPRIGDQVFLVDDRRGTVADLENPDWILVDSEGAELWFHLDELMAAKKPGCWRATRHVDPAS